MKPFDLIKAEIASLDLTSSYVLYAPLLRLCRVAYLQHSRFYLEEIVPYITKHVQGIRMYVSCTKSYLRSIEAFPFAEISLVLEGHGTDLSKLTHTHQITTVEVTNLKGKKGAVSKWFEGKDYSSLTYLNLSQTFLSNADLHTLVTVAPNVTSLIISGCELSSESIEILAELKHLRLLDLSDNDIRHKGASLLSCEDMFDKLEHLDMTRCNIQDDGAIALAQTQKFTSLITLTLDCNAIGEEGCFALYFSPGLKHLENLNLSRNPIGREAREQLQKYTPTMTEVVL